MPSATTLIYERSYGDASISEQLFSLFSPRVSALAPGNWMATGRATGRATGWKTDQRDYQGDGQRDGGFASRTGNKTGNGLGNGVDKALLFCRLFHYFAAIIFLGGAQQ